MNSELRESLTPAERALPLRLTIDPGFVNHRRIQTIIGPRAMTVVDGLVRELPAMPDWQREVRIDHIYTRVLLGICNSWGVAPLEYLVSLEENKLFCSTEELAPCPEVYNSQRATSLWIPRREHSRIIEFEYSTAHIRGDTLRSVLHQGGSISIVAELGRVTESSVVFHPLVMGFPWLETDDPELEGTVMWWGRDFYENFIEDFDEFSRVSGVPTPPDSEPMKAISENALKLCLASLLGDTVEADWGGEGSDFFSSHIHLQGRRHTAAFLLKGPARFAPMGLNHLGKNNDQIVRLANEPAQVLVVQHSHDILQPVRATLRAFAVQPSRPRRYCLIDGRDSLRLLQAYGLYERALELSART
jgi:hypothetical protein